MFKKFSDIFIFIFFIITGLVAVFVMGKDSSWDLANYHYYSVWALLHGRIGLDIMPCGIQSYFNPLIDFPLYFLIKNFNDKPLLISSLLSTSYGFAAFFAYKIVALIFNGKYRRFLMACSVIIGSTGIIAFLNIGLSFGDTFITAFLLCGLYILLKNIFEENSSKRSVNIFLSGIIIGFATGLKPCGTVCIAGVIAAEIFFIKKYQNPVKILSLTFSGIIIGILISGGWWYYLIWKKFGNPIFPMYNQIFKSTMAFNKSYINVMFIPDSLPKYLFFPFYWNFYSEQRVTLPFPFFDLRGILVYISVFIILFFNFLIKMHTEKIELYLSQIINIHLLNFTTVMISCSYLYWIKVFGIIRFIEYIEFLSGIFVVMILVYISFIIRSKKIMLIICILSIIGILTSTKYTDSGMNRLPITDSPKYLDFENFNLPDNSVLLFLGVFPEPVYMPFQNPKTRCILLINSVHNEKFDYNFEYTEGEEKKIEEIINKAQKQGGVYLLYSKWESAKIGWDYASKFGINEKDYDCREADNNFRINYFFCSPKTSN